MDEVKIIWTHIAIQQRNKIFEYWNLRNGNTNFSQKLNRQIYRKVDLLQSNPLLGNTSSIHPFRILHFGHYSLVYKFLTPNLHIISFWDNRQNPNKLQKLLGL